MFDATPSPPSQPPQLARSGRASRFVNGEHTAADETTRQIVLEILAELDLVPDITPYMPPFPSTGVTSRTRETVEKFIGFMASFLNVALNARSFGILMDRHRWTDTPCGYKAAKTITTALLTRGYIVKVVAPSKGQSAVYRCSEGFEERLRGWEPLLAFKRMRPAPVEVREPKLDYKGSHKKKRLPFGRFCQDDLKRFQRQVLRLNKHLSRHPLVDASGRCRDTTLRRIFTGNLRSGGRLYGDYQNMPEKDRLGCTIDGEAVREIDLKASHVAILAAIYGHPERLPQDPYGAIDWVTTPLLRKAAKIIVQVVVHAERGRPTRFPRQRGGIPFRSKYGLEDKHITELLPGLFEVMPFLANSPNLTLPLQFLEAELLIGVLDDLCRLGIPALPIHDSLLVRRSDEQKVLEVLQEALKTALGPHAPWLDVSSSDEPPRLIPPLPCPMDAKYALCGAIPKICKPPRANREEYSCEEDDPLGTEIFSKEPANDGDF